MKCPICKGARFENGTLALYNSISYLVFHSEKKRFITLGNSLGARVCLRCGRLELFAPAKAFRKTSGQRTAHSGQGRTSGQGPAGRGQRTRGGVRG